MHRSDFYLAAQQQATKRPRERPRGRPFLGIRNQPCFIYRISDARLSDARRA